MLGKAINIEYGIIEKKLGNIESMLSKFENWKPTPHGVGGGGVGWWLLDDRGCYDPVAPPFDPQFDPEFDVI